jgi:hypothetical protein
LIKYSEETRIAQPSADKFSNDSTLPKMAGTSTLWLCQRLAALAGVSNSGILYGWAVTLAELDICGSLIADFL